MDRNTDVFLVVFISVFGFVFLVLAITFLIVFLKKNKEYKNGAYYQSTKLSYFSVIHNAGRYGEYLIYESLKQLEENGAKFLFNIYLPKRNGETTEIDVLLISKKGLYVFESKNYSGWIFGNEKQRSWYQTLRVGRRRSRKHCFYNPIMQNRAHVKNLSDFLGASFPVWSIIVFSDRCVLKSINLSSNDVSVINRYNVVPVISNIFNHITTDLLTDNDITEIYNRLYPYTQVDENLRMRHVVSIYNNLSVQPSQRVFEARAQENLQQQSEKGASLPHATTTEGKNGFVNVKTSTNGAERVPQKCPRCNGVLILRTVKRGANMGNQFYGCSNYPKCKYIQNINDKNP